jgi:hypothetical protein
MKERRPTGRQSGQTAREEARIMVGCLLWVLLFIVCWPVALAALILYPIVWLLLLPFRIAGIAVDGALRLVWAVITLPARVIGGLGR